MYTIVGNKLDFFWDTDRIFDLVSYSTGVKARNIANGQKQEGEDSELDYVVTDDQREYVVEELKPIFLKLFDFFVDIAYPDSNMLYVSRPDADLGFFISGFSVICRLNKAGKVIINEQRLGVISSLCQDYIVLHLVNKWCKDNRLSEFLKSQEDEILSIESKLRKNVLYLKKRGYDVSFS